LKILGERETAIIGKELEIRRALSPKHLYSSAFVVAADDQGTWPKSFTLIGAGWGHGVGLCQIGAALMAERGYNYKQILTHYYPGAELHNNF
jgi:SpoIID/LytB domain protein